MPLAAAVILLAAVPSAQFTGWQWVSLGLTLVVVVGGAWPVYRGAVRALRHARATADVLASLSLTASVLWSVQALLVGGAGQLGLRSLAPLGFTLVSQGTLVLEVSVSLAVLLLAGRYLQARAVRGCPATAAPLVTDRVTAAPLVTDRVTAAPLVTDRVTAAPLVTDRVTAAPLVTDRVTAPPLVTDRVTAPPLVTDRVTAPPLVTDRVTAAPLVTDRVAAVLLPCVISVAVATLGFWLGAGLPGPAAAGAAFAVLVLACPATLGLAAPTAWLAAQARAADLGIEVRRLQALGARRIRAVVLTVPGAGQPVTVAEVARLRGAGLRVGLLTPGSRPAALAAAGALGIPADSVFSGVRPEQQAGVVRELQAAGFGVAFAGDGGTDAAGLAQADLGIAMSRNPDDGPADVVLTSEDPCCIADAVLLAGAITTTLRGNLGWALASTVPALPLAALGYLSPLLVVTAAAASALIIWANSLRLRRSARGGAARGKSAPGRAARGRPGGPAGSPGAVRRGRDRPGGVSPGTGSPGAARRGTGSLGAARRATGSMTRLAGVARAARAPVACAAVVIGLLTGWVATGGAGTLHRVRVQIELATLPLPRNLAGRPAVTSPVAAYLVIRNLGGPDELLSAHSALARRTVLARHGDDPSGTAGLLPGIPVPAGQRVSLSPFTADVVLLGARPLHAGEQVPVTLTFRHAGQVTAALMVTAPGTP